MIHYEEEYSLLEKSQFIQIVEKLDFYVMKKFGCMKNEAMFITSISEF